MEIIIALGKNSKIFETRERYTGRFKWKQMVDEVTKFLSELSIINFSVLELKWR